MDRVEREKETEIGSRKAHVQRWNQRNPDTQTLRHIPSDRFTWRDGLPIH